jgi:hypothetical protein
MCVLLVSTVMMIWETFFPAINQRDFQLLIFDSLTLWHFDRHFQLFNGRTHARLLPEPIQSHYIYIRRAVSICFAHENIQKLPSKEAYFSIIAEIFTIYC